MKLQTVSKRWMMTSGFCCTPSSDILAGVSCGLHHVCVGVLADHLHQAHEPPEGGECVRLRGSADVGDGLPV